MLKLFVWKDVFTDYTSGIAFAIAKNKEEAIECAIGDEPGKEWKANELRNAECEEHSLKKSYGGHVVGGS